MAGGVPLDVKTKSKGDGVYTCLYTPTEAVKHTVSVWWGGVSVPNSPFRVSSPTPEPRGAKISSSSSTNLSVQSAQLPPLYLKHGSANELAVDSVQSEGTNAKQFNQVRPTVEPSLSERFLKSVTRRDHSPLRRSRSQYSVFLDTVDHPQGQQPKTRPLIIMTTYTASRHITSVCKVHY